MASSTFSGNCCRGVEPWVQGPACHAKREEGPEKEVAALPLLPESLPAVRAPVNLEHLRVLHDEHVLHSHSEGYTSQAAASQMPRAGSCPGQCGRRPVPAENLRSLTDELPNLKIAARRQGPLDRSFRRNLISGAKMHNNASSDPQLTHCAF